MKTPYDKLDELDALAQKATPGPWEPELDADPVLDVGPWVIVHTQDNGVDEMLADMVTKDDAAFIAAANPQTVLGLIADLRAERERWRALREWLAPETEAAPPGSEAAETNLTRFARGLLDEVLARMDELEAGQ